MPVREIRNSAAIERVGYNDETHNLSIWFKGGGRYIYSDVPRSIYDALCEAGSVGRFVGEVIKGKFPCRPVNRQRGTP
jgi:hypothetical protein